MTPLKFILHALALYAIALSMISPIIAQQEPETPSRGPVATPPPEHPQTSDAEADQVIETMLPHFKDTRFWLSGQANFIFQTHPPFYAVYSGSHSLSPKYEKATSRVLTLYTGARLNNSTEVLVYIEEAGGGAVGEGFGFA